ncbi:MAG: glycine cleavage system protein GcvH [Deltaproteobacteria bacterium]|nr:glycine cleavage system protein GcvH [Deltaproteobacteria bacterium]
MSIPADRKYTSHDEWVLLDGDIATIGITDFAQDALGDLVFIDLPEAGATFAAGDALCEVESVKAVAEVYAPVGGEVVAVNEELDGSEGTVNSDPYGAGWLLKLRVTDAAELDALMDAAAYEAKVSES